MDLIFFICRNPSIESDTPFKPIKSPDEIFVQDITNDSKTSVVTDILQRTHYDVWQEIENCSRRQY